MNRIAGCLLALAACALAPAHAADVYKLVVPFPPGGPVDQAARMIQPGLAEALGVTVIIDNRGGAGGTIGVNMVATAPRDGKTLLLASAAFVFTGGTMPSLPYDPRKDLEPIALLGEVQSLLVARNGLGVSTLGELIAKGKAGTRITFGSAGVGSTMHIAGEMINLATGTHFVHVPYRGAAPALVDLLAGTVDILDADLPGLIPYVRDHRVTALAVYDTVRSPLLPDVPTAAEAGVPQLKMGNWYGVMAPTGIPEATRAKLEAALLKAAREPATAARMAEAGMGPPMGTAQFQAKLDSEFDTWLPFIRKAGIQAQ
jgi:tripartite-type tricarboxylate transporter receptor subunit TctC